MCPRIEGREESPSRLPTLSLREDMKRWLEEWRKESVPERDGLLGETEGDNVAHLIVRGAFLDYYFADEKIRAIINGWVNRTPLKDTVKQVEFCIRTIGRKSFGMMRLGSRSLTTMMRFPPRICRKLTPTSGHFCMR